MDNHNLSYQWFKYLVYAITFIDYNSEYINFNHGVGVIGNRHLTLDHLMNLEELLLHNPFIRLNPSSDLHLNLFCWMNWPGVITSYTNSFLLIWKEEMAKLLTLILKELCILKVCFHLIWILHVAYLQVSFIENVSLTKCTLSRPDRIVPIAERFGMDAGAVLDNVSIFLAPLAIHP